MSIIEGSISFACGGNMKKILLYMVVIMTTHTVFSMNNKPWSSTFEQLVRKNVNSDDYQDFKQEWNHDFNGISVNRYVPLLRCAIAELYAKRRAILYGDYQDNLRDFVRKMVGRGLPVTPQEATFLNSKEPGLLHSNVPIFEPECAVVYETNIPTKQNSVVSPETPDKKSSLQNSVVSPVGQGKRPSFSCTDTRHCTPTPTPNSSVIQWRPIHNSPNMLHTSGSSSSSLSTPVNILSPDNLTEPLVQNEHNSLIRPTPWHQ